MKCPKCGYTSFPYLESCRKCGRALAEPRAALGLYAQRPDPPDLLLAYQAASTDVTETTAMPPASALSLDLDHLEEIELEVAEAESTTPGTDEGGEPVSPASESMLTLDREVIAEAESPPLEPSELADIALELENAVDLGDKLAERSQTPKDSSEGEPVYDLDLAEDLDDLPLQSLEDESHTGDVNDDEEVVEYTLEIEDDLEFEIDELEVEQDDDAEAEDDDER
jgi:hypothetical protein